MLKTLAGFFEIRDDCESQRNDMYDIYDTRYIYYMSEKSDELIELNGMVQVHGDGMFVGNDFVKYENIATFNNSYVNNTVMFTTFTDSVGRRLVCTDSIGQLALVFHDVENLNLFILKILRQILKYKDSGNFNKNILKYKSFSKIFNKKNV